jgi:lipoic acid synthetase
LVFLSVYSIFAPIGKIINKKQMPEVSDNRVNVKNKPDWLKTKLQFNGDKGAGRCSNELGDADGNSGGHGYASVAKIVGNHGLHTICESGRCPNKVECWSRRTATFMVLGDVCTRACKFCATTTGKPLPPDDSEPLRVARSVALMGLKHAVITSVTRDDLDDGGARHWAAVIEAVRAQNPDTTIEVLIPDFDGNTELVDTVLKARPDITGHNIETISRLTPLVRSRARYGVSLEVLRHIASHNVAKSGIMLGLGESADEVLGALDDLRDAGVSIVTLGQYLRPTMKHLPVAEYVRPEVFEFFKTEALARGFSYVASGPLVRSSYLAEKALGAIAI